MAKEAQRVNLSHLQIMYDIVKADLRPTIQQTFEMIRDVMEVTGHLECLQEIVIMAEIAASSELTDENEVDPKLHELYTYLSGEDVPVSAVLERRSAKLFVIPKKKEKDGPA
jgi:hypothetical protein